MRYGENGLATQGPFMRRRNDIYRQPQENKEWIKVSDTYGIMLCTKGMWANGRRVQVFCCTVGNADDMGEICDWLTSSEMELRCVEALVLGVGGTFPVGDTLPMNHD